MRGPEATLRIPLESEEQARRIEAALRVDDDAFTRTRREGHVLVVEVRAASLRSILRAVDDVLANASVSEDLLKPPPFDDERA